MKGCFGVDGTKAVFTVNENAFFGLEGNKIFSGMSFPDGCKKAVFFRKQSGEGTVPDRPCLIGLQQAELLLGADKNFACR